MDKPNKTIEKPFREWQIIGLILIALVALGLGQAVKKRPNNFPATPPTPHLEPVLPLSRSDLDSKIRLDLDSKIRLNINGNDFEIELAQTEAEMAQGLSGRPSLGENEGMLFVYGDPSTGSGQATPSFWMKEMNFPIDIIWLDQDKKVIEITPSLSPDTFPKTFSPKIPVQFVLEVPAGTASKTNLKIGDLIHFSL